MNVDWILDCWLWKMRFLSHQLIYVLFLSFISRETNLSLTSYRKRGSLREGQHRIFSAILGLSRHATAMQVSTTSLNLVLANHEHRFRSSQAHLRKSYTRLDSFEVQACKKSTLCILPSEGSDQRTAFCVLSSPVIQAGGLSLSLDSYKLSLASLTRHTKR